MSAASAAHTRDAPRDGRPRAPAARPRRAAPLEAARRSCGAASLCRAGSKSKAPKRDKYGRPAGATGAAGAAAASSRRAPEIVERGAAPSSGLARRPVRRPGLSAAKQGVLARRRHLRRRDPVGGRGGTGALQGRRRRRGGPAAGRDLRGGRAGPRAGAAGRDAGGGRGARRGVEAPAARGSRARSRTRWARAWRRRRARRAAGERGRRGRGGRRGARAEGAGALRRRGGGRDDDGRGGAGAAGRTAAKSGDGARRPRAAYWHELLSFMKCPCLDPCL